ncbi:MAG: hypothetical protein HYR51_04975 [Candidatus Rokubacteria bacterium]|nr:hypothetical protein [Candidatus Rokubacteria bacterium]
MITLAPSLPPATVRRVVLTLPAIAPDLLLRLQKYRNPLAAPDAIREAAAAAAHQATRLVSPRAVIWRGGITALDAGGRITLAGPHEFRSRLLARVLSSSADAYVVVLTIGDALERRVDALFRQHCALEGLLLDTAGWAAIVLLTRRLRRRLRDDERRAGRSVTHRVGPGHGDWPLDEQAALLRVFGDVPLPVTVTESSLMLPRKSVSAVFGVVPAA